MTILPATGLAGRSARPATRRPSCALRALLALLLLSGTATMMVACGKKPSAVVAPAGAGGPFPRTYPDPSTGTGVWDGRRPEAPASAPSPVPAPSSVPETGGY